MPPYPNAKPIKGNKRLSKLPFNILIAPDSFKGSLGAQAVITALTRGIHQENKNLNITSHPMADGGEGSLAILKNFLPLKKVYVKAHDALFEQKRTYYLFSPTTRTAYIELAKISGLTLASKQTSPLHTTTFGTGELIAHALKKGAKTIYLLVGGSATTDGGIGIAGALGFNFATKLTHQNQKHKKHSELLKQHELTGKHLERIKRILTPNDKINHTGATATNKVRAIQKKFFLISKAKFILINDVKNPLYGRQGAAHVFGPQKGANQKAIEILDNGLRNIGILFGKQISQSAGSGAAGGVGGGAMYFLRAKKMSGIDFFAEQTGLEKKIISADLVISGEGRLDAQTSYGKVVSGVAKLAKKHRRPLLVVCGQSTLGQSTLIGAGNENGNVTENEGESESELKKMYIKAVYTLLSYAPDVKTAIANPRPLLMKVGREIASSLKNNS